MYLEKEFLDPIEIESYYFKTLKDLSKAELYELSRIFTTVFNADNIEVIKKLEIEGRTVKEGLWNERPHNIEEDLETIKEYLKDGYLSCVLIGKNQKIEFVIGALIVQKKNLENMLTRGYEINFEIPAGTEFWCEVDTFKREVCQNGKRISGLTKIMRDNLLKNYKSSNPILLYSSTNNPFMVAAWEKDGFTVVERMTTFGNKYQSYKLILNK